MTNSAQPEKPLFVNRDVLAGRTPNAFAAHSLQGRDELNRPVITMVENTAGIVMTKPDNCRAWLKSKFQTLVKPEAALELLSQARNDFGVSNDEDLRKMRTIGCGTNVILMLNEGAYYPTIERTAPKKTEDGAVNPGLYTRPAGGSRGDIDTSALCELNEELFIVVKMGTSDSALHITPKDYSVDGKIKRSIMDERRQRFPEILAAHGRIDIQLTREINVYSDSVSVTELTEDIVERTAKGDKILKNRVFVDSPHQMDINGVDTITVLHLPCTSINDIVGIYDGETNVKGELLKRKCALLTYTQIHNDLAGKIIAMSPTPARVVEARDKVMTAIHRQLGL